MEPGRHWRLGQFPLDAKSLEVLTVSAAAERFPRLRGKLSSWEQLQQKLVQVFAAPSREEIVHRALTLTQFLEALYAAADVFPVGIVEPTNAAQTPEGDVILRLRSRPDSDRSALSDALGLKSLARRLDSALQEERARDESWILTGSRSLGERMPSDTEWQFRQVEEQKNAPPTYVFTGPSYVPVISNAFLISAGSLGEGVQFRRRLKALSALKLHVELLRMLADPRGRILDSHDKFSVDKDFELLDLPKQDALRQLTATIPLYLVQGPPGAGKTRLVRDLVRRRFLDESTTRLLLTAQSNSAVDHLMDELEAILSKDDDTGPLVVRSRAKDSGESSSHFELGLQSAEIVRHLVASDLEQVPARLNRRISRGE